MRRLAILFFLLPFGAYAQTADGNTKCDYAGDQIFMSSAFNASYKAYAAKKYQELEATMHSSGNKSLGDIATTAPVPEQNEQLIRELTNAGITNEFCEGQETIDQTLTAAYMSILSLWQPKPR